MQAAARRSWEELVQAEATRVAQAEEAYARERAASLVATWRFCTLEVPAVLVHLRSIEASRVEQLSEARRRALGAMSHLPGVVARAIEARTQQAAALAAAVSPETGVAV